MAGFSVEEILGWLVKHYPDIHDLLVGSLADERSAETILEGDGASAKALEELEKR
jgi:hypothetical protein